MFSKENIIKKSQYRKDYESGLNKWQKKKIEEKKKK